jgi:hypothetical protein
VLRRQLDDADHTRLAAHSIGAKNRERPPDGAASVAQDDLDNAG